MPKSFTACSKSSKVETEAETEDEFKVEIVKLDDF